MSGHSKWATIKRKKAALDAKRGKIFTRLIKEITIAARHGGGDPDGNPRLRLAIDNAKSANMPADNIDRAIKKATGELEGTAFHEVMYEGYGPGGIAILIEAATDNKNRTFNEVRHTFTKNNCALGEVNSVAWMFEHKGIISVKREGRPEDEMMEIIIDANADDLHTDEEYFEVVTTLESFESARKYLLGKKLNIENASLQWVAKNLVEIRGEDSEKLMRLVETIEECDDVQDVFTNADFTE